MDTRTRGDRRPVFLIHGGLAEDIGSDRFWVRPGIVAALRAAGASVAAPDRDTTPASWAAAADAAAAAMVAVLDPPATVVAGSNGVSVAVRLAIARPDLVARLVLLWPATAGDPIVDAAVPVTAEHLLAGDTIRGTTDAELGSLRVPVAVMAADPENRVHQHRTVDRLVAHVPGAIRIPAAFPESPRPGFADRLDEFVTVLLDHI